ncbi:SRPBCC family protein [Inquilinus limosus]|uniref:SRPBCC family protein n=1 Tax=Inquilinus limosus TaxID=171674 RepID=UPI003F15354E
MTPTIAVAPVRKSIRVRTEPRRAFDVFTAGMTRWWPRRHSIGGSPIKEVVVEPEAGGRWFERGEDGTECQWGKVLAWEPPARLVLAWQINTQWRYDPDLVTELEVRFSADGDGTLVELEHRLDGYGEDADRMRQVFDGPEAWEATLAGFAGAVG